MYHAPQPQKRAISQESVYHHPLPNQAAIQELRADSWRKLNLSSAARILVRSPLHLWCFCNMPCAMVSSTEAEDKQFDIHY